MSFLINSPSDQWLLEIVTPHWLESFKWMFDSTGIYGPEGLEKTIFQNTGDAVDLKNN